MHHASASFRGGVLKITYDNAVTSREGVLHRVRDLGLRQARTPAPTLPYPEEAATRRTLVANLAFALGMIVLMIASILLTRLPLPLAVVGHEDSTVLVSLNGLRLLGFRRKGGERG